MTRRQTVTWTALPNGVVGSGGDARLRLSVHVAPRLWSDESSRPRLTDFPDFLDWPARNPGFFVQFGASAPIVAAVVSEPPSSSRWAALFTPDTFVRRREFQSELTKQPILSYPVQNVLAFLRGRYARVAEEFGDTPPSVSTLLHPDLFGQVAFPSQRETAGVKLPDPREIRADIESDLARLGAIPPRPPDPTRDFLRAQMFHQRPEQTRLPRSSNGQFSTAQADEADLDFHQVLSALNEFPLLMRQLGLVFDLEVPLTPAVPRGETTVQAIPDWEPLDPSTTSVPGRPGAPTSRLATRCVVGDDVFTPLPRAGSGDIVDGALRLEDRERFALVQIDQDGAALSALGLGANLARTLSAGTPTTPTEATLPSLRSAGIAIAIHGRAQDTRDTWARQESIDAALNAGTDITLSAEDLTRGWAVDVFDAEEGAWYSLCERVGTYRFLRDNTVLTQQADEGAVTMSLTGTPDGSSPNLFQAETLARWRGWSLVVPQPGMVVDSAGNPATFPNASATDAELEVHLDVRPQSLPALRFGRRYRMRARAVDLAGNRAAGDSEQFAGLRHASRELTYGRFEPLASPTLLLRTARTEGESAERLVLRGNWDRAPIPPTNERHVLPPKIAASMAETHGLFDRGGALDPEAHGRYLSAPPGDTGRPWEGGSIEDVGVIDAEDYGLPFADRDTLSLPYLPDPFARGVIVRDAPGASGPLRVPFENESDRWPNAKPFRLVLRDGNRPPELGAGEVTLYVPRGEVARLRVSSYMDESDVVQMGLLQWLEEEGRSVDAAIAGAINGSHWMLTPPRELTLVNAVRQPVRAPRIEEIAVFRDFGKAVASLVGEIGLHRPSTASVDVLAAWDDPVDVPTEPAPRTVSSRQRAFTLAVPEEPADGDPADRLHFPSEAKPNSARQEFPDTKHRRVQYSLDAASRYAEYFLERRKDVTLSDQPLQLTSAGVVPGSEAVRASDGSTSFGRGEDYEIDYEAGTMTGSAPGRVNIAFIARPVSRPSFDPVEVNVLSAAPPATPKLLYVVPAFFWFLNDQGDTKVSSRLGGTLRVYLDRPWYSSGEGEELGVVLWRRDPGSTALVPPEPLKPYVTQWGQDPLYASGRTSGIPTTAAFPQRKTTRGFVPLLEQPSTLVDVAGHDVAFDPVRRLWFSDVEIDVDGSYAPFVRLALARFQPDAIPGAHLSPVVLADVISLPNDRFASVVRDPEDPKVLSLSVAGRSYTAVRGVDGPGYIEAHVERLRPGVDPAIAGELAWEAVAGEPGVVDLDPEPISDDGATLWSSRLRLPAEPGPYRLVLREFEVFSTGGTTTINGVPFFLPAQRRLVYADAIELS